MDWLDDVDTGADLLMRYVFAPVLWVLLSPLWGAARVVRRMRGRR